MVMKIGRAKLHIRIPTAAQELRRDDLLRFMGIGQRLVEGEIIPLNRHYACDFKGISLIHTHADEYTRLESLCAAHLDTILTGGDPLHNRLPFHRKGANTLLIIKASVDTIARLHIKLNHMNM